MKNKIIGSAVLATVATVILAGCSPGRQNFYSDRYSAGQPGISLIMHSSPGTAINRYSDGRYYFRNPNGYTYWRGNDNRYYLDRSNIIRVPRNHRQYNEWNNGYRKHEHKKHYQKNRH
ncbi:MAG: hypothetical protein ACSLE0_19410 [Chitinophagaceae bacterium]